MSREEKKLLRKTRKGDSVAFEEIVRRYQSLVYSSALQVVKDPAAAQDVAQESFIAAYLSLANLRSVDAFLHGSGPSRYLNLLPIGPWDDVHTIPCTTPKKNPGFLRIPRNQSRYASSQVKEYLIRLGKRLASIQKRKGYSLRNGARKGIENEERRIRLRWNSPVGHVPRIPVGPKLSVRG